MEPTPGLFTWLKFITGTDTLSNIGGGKAYCFDKTSLHFTIVSEKKTTVLRKIGGDRKISQLMSAFASIAELIAQTRAHCEEMFTRTQNYSTC